MSTPVIMETHTTSVEPFKVTVEGLGTFDYYLPLLVDVDGVGGSFNGLYHRGKSPYDAEKKDSHKVKASRVL